jgi:hypothetical protein
MTPAEKFTLTNAVIALADPKGNWDMAWQLICEVAHLDPKQYKPAFKAQTLDILPLLPPPQESKHPAPLSRA